MSAGAPEKEILVGGQAVMEGVMMKLPRSWAVTVRRADGSLVSRSGAHVPWTDRWPILRLPLLRGVAILVSTLGLGMRSLFFSSDVLARDMEAAEAAGSSSSAPGPRIGPSTLACLMLSSALTSGPEGDEDLPSESAPSPATHETAASPDGGGMKWWELALSIGMALGMFLVIFKALPLGVAWLAARAWPALGEPVGESVINGLALLVIFVAYLGLMSLIPDIRRVFQYHGAEHKVVWMHEHGDAPTIANADRYSTFHPRCGTSFLVFMVGTSIVVWALASGLLAEAGIEQGFMGKLGLRLALFPLIIGLSYELIRFTARHHERGLFRALVAPGLWSQRITTKPPDAGMLEVSLRSLALAQEAENGRQASSD